MFRVDSRYSVGSLRSLLRARSARAPPSFTSLRRLALILFRLRYHYAELRSEVPFLFEELQRLLPHLGGDVTPPRFGSLGISHSVNEATAAPRWGAPRVFLPVLTRSVNRQQGRFTTRRKFYQRPLRGRWRINPNKNHKNIPRTR